jgi:ubiquinol-cytochrome c reductase cytochrome b subunit
MANFIFLTWIGSKPVEEPFILLGQVSSVFYFSYFLLIIPTVGYIENKLLFNKY